jgi:hypothetical protein
MDSKDTNPKDAIGSKKLPLHLIPGSLKVYAAKAFLEGALKYGKYNWRIAGVRTSIYLDAIERHLEKFKNGQWADPDTEVEHLASIIACCGIILDARLVGKLNDDRPPMAPVDNLIDQAAQTVEHLQKLFADKMPHQYTIEDSQWQPESQPPDTTKSITQVTRQSSKEPLGIVPGETQSIAGSCEKVTTRN